jgi:hypothetical protein
VSGAGGRAVAVGGGGVTVGAGVGVTESHCDREPGTEQAKRLMPSKNRIGKRIVRVFTL